MSLLDELHNLLVSPKNPTDYPSLTVDYNRELFSDLIDNMVDWHITGYTVCGAEDPGVLHITKEIGRLYPQLKGYSVVRIIDRFLNEWSSETLLEFSNEDMTEAEYKLYEKVMEENDV